MAKEPLVSVIIPTYNRKHTLQRCIDSVLGQTYRNFEIIIVDDCSTDGTMEFVESQYGDVTDIDIVYVRNDDNLGPSASRNIGVSCANGEYIAFHDSDDEWYLDKLEKQMEHFARCNQEVGAVYSLFYINGSDSYVYPPRDADLAYKSGYIFYSLLCTPLIGMITLVMRKSVFMEVGGFNEQLNSLVDYEFTIRIAKNYGIMLVDEILAVAYESENSVGKRNRDKIVTQCYIMDLYHEELSLSGLKKKKFELVYQDACKYHEEEFFCKCIMQLSKDQDYLSFAKEKWEKLYPSSRPETVNTLDISGVSACTGCMACYNVCPVDAISQGYDDEGFLVPVIDVGKCIQCGRCKEICPVCNETQGTVLQDECYAVMADSEIRKKSSSGGIFRVLADQVLEEGGYVSGAVWNDDWQVVHIVSNAAEDIERMMSSKYVQSNVGNTYQKIRELLEQSKKVLFVGCSCQVVGLKRYLGKEYNNLLLVDVVCHGVPSQKTFDTGLKDKQIEDISFRKKQVFGWGVGLYVKYQDGTEYIGNKKDPYMFGFLNNWFLRNSCYNCQFKNKKYSDLSLGDFWGINKIYKFDDGLGTSFVTVNSGKGAAFFKQVLPQFEKIVGLQTKAAESFNPCISTSVREPRCRELFFEEWKHSNHKDLAEIMQAVKERIHFDIALVCLWGINYGNAMTNYALHAFLQVQGKKVVVLDNYCPLKPINQFKEFAERHYILSSEYFPAHDYEMLNGCCDAFVVGSDQSWNYFSAKYYKYGNYFLLDFVKNNKKKASYGTSFGEAKAAVSAEIGQKLYQDFHAISVREEFGVELCRNMYGVNASWVLDPVFLLNKRDYDALLDSMPIREKEPYIAVYFLNPTEEKRKLCLQIQQQIGSIKLINIMDANLRSVDYYFRMLEYDNIRTELPVEEWLSYMRNASFIITDSYHGTCFAMIFEKNFVTVINRQSARFETFDLFPEIRGRIIENNAQYEAAKFIEDIDYDAVNKKLEAEIEKSKQFIRENIL
ncbi:MAG: glycosyltransferase [Lachnospiraceae bacterium]|nr:glycosyltransferase [Lachnospiraceae bacterium]